MRPILILSAMVVLVVAAVAAALSLLWLIGYLIQGQFHLLAGEHYGLVATSGAGLVFVGLGAILAMIGFVLFVFGVFAYWLLDETIEGIADSIRYRHDRRIPAE